MYKSLVIAFGFLAMFGNSVTAEISDMSKLIMIIKLYEVRKECLKEHPLTQEEYNTFKKFNFPESDVAKCFAACTLRSYGLMDKYGNYTVDPAMENLSTVINDEEDLKKINYFYHSCYKGVNSVRIVNLRVPEVIQFGSKDAVTLDCDYVTGNVTGLVLKWFYMDKSQPVYQWIPPQKPQALGLLKHKLDLSYVVSNNPYTQHRAMRILSPGTDLTGNYTCVVSTFLAEDERTKPMTIFIPERMFDMFLDRLDDGYLSIICTADGVFPKPELTILAGNRPLHAKTSIKQVNDRYTVVTSAIVKIETLPPTVEVLCDMQVPLANYFSRKRDIFYRDPPPTTPDPPNSAYSRDKGHLHHPLPFLIFLSLAILIRLQVT